MKQYTLMVYCRRGGLSCDDGQETQERYASRKKAITALKAYTNRTDSVLKQAYDELHFRIYEEGTEEAIERFSWYKPSNRPCCPLSGCCGEEF